MIERQRRRVVRLQGREGQGDDLAIVCRGFGIVVDVGDHRAVPGFPHDQGFRIVAGNDNRLLAGLEGRAAVRRQVACRIFGVEAFDKQVLNVDAGRGHAPGDRSVVADQQEGNARYRSPCHLQGGGFDPRQIPEDGRLQAEMRIVGQQRGAGIGMVAGDNPCVGRALGGDGRGRGGKPVQRRAGHRTREGGGRRADRRIQVIQLCHRQHVEQPMIGQFAAEIVRQQQGHQLAPDHTVGRAPRFRSVGESGDVELWRQRAVMAVEPGIHPCGVAVQGCARVVGQGLDLGFGSAVCADRSHEPIERQGKGTVDLGKPAGADPPLPVHLPEAILSVHIAEGEIRVCLVGGEDMRNRMPVAHDLHRRLQASQPYRSVIRRQPGPQPDETGNRSDQNEHQHSNDGTAEPLHALGSDCPRDIRTICGTAPK